MLTPTHPEEERLAALAADEPDATDDRALVTHVAGCDRCRLLTDDVRALRAALAALPDVAPSRPLRLLPPADEPMPGAADRLGGWVRRAFAPLVTAGAALALAGVIGTVGPFAGIGGQASGPASEDAAFDAGAERAASGAPAPAAAPAEPSFLLGGGADDAEQEADGDSAETEGGDMFGAQSTDGTGAALGGEAEAEADEAQADEAAEPVRAALPERSIWPLVLFAGVALIILAALLRWVLAPRPV